MSHNFIITSHGWSGSNWVANSFNLHPDIICTHSAINILPDEKVIHEDGGLKKNIQRFHKGYVNRVQLTINEAYQEIRGFGKAKHYGSVHLFRLRDMPSQIKRSTPLNSDYSVLNLVRNPVSLVWSGCGQFKSLFRFDLNELHWTLGKLLSSDKDFVFEMGDKYDLMLGDNEILSFICAARVLESLHLDLKGEIELESMEIPDSIRFLGHVKMEEITSRDFDFRKLFTTLGFSDLEVTPEYLAAVYGSGKLNRHKKERKDLTVRDLYHSFSPWQKEVFLHFFNKYNLKDPYTKMGYDLSFLDE